MRSPAYRDYMLLVLVLVGVFSYFDRFVFALLLEPIKHDLGLSDSQLGLMTGIAFAAFYAVAGIPIARWADRGNRVTISALSVGLLGIAISLCGLVTSFMQLLTARAAVAVGEAGSVPAAQSLISDHYNRAERPKALAIYFMNASISMIIGYLVGGWLLDSFGWRNTLLIVGTPGFLVALLVKLTLKEPRQQTGYLTTVGHVNLKDSFLVLWQQRSFRHVFIAFCVAYLFGMGVSQWQAAFFMRTHAMQGAELGAWLALAWGVCGVLGNYLGGQFATRFAANNERLQFRVTACLWALNVPVNLFIYLAPDKYWALSFIAVNAVLTTFGNGTVFAAIQSLSPPQLRSVAVALIFLFANLIGFGLGPLGLGVLSDLLHPAYGQDSLRFAFIVFCPIGFWVAFHYWRVGQSITEDINKVARSQ